MLEPLLLLGITSKLWNAVPLIVIISLVYAASRNETMPAIVAQATRLAIYITAFLAAVFVLLMVLQSRL